MSATIAMLEDETARRRDYPIAAEQIFFAHAGISPLPRVVGDAMREFIGRAEGEHQESEWMIGKILRTRDVAADLIGATAEEIALLGPTSLGLSLVANGLPWEVGDEVVFYQGDYPANVYPWRNLAFRGVEPVEVKPEFPGAITWETVEAALTDRTRLVALASCNFLTGYRIDIDTIGRNLRERDILFCVDAIQTCGAFPTRVDHVDFLSADSHKWMLGPAAAGIVYIRKECQNLVQPTLIGAFNVKCPDYVAQETLEFYPSARRYEPGVLNLPGIVGMLAAMELLLDAGIDNVASRLLGLRGAILEGLRPLGFHLCVEDDLLGPEPACGYHSAIVTVGHKDRDIPALRQHLLENGVIASLRNSPTESYIRFSPHFYNTLDEVDRVVELMR